MYRGIIPCVFKPRLSFVQSDHLLDKKQPARLINSKITHHHLGSQNRFTWNCLKQKRNVFGIRKYKSAMKDGINMISVYTSRPTQLFTYCNTATCFGPLTGPASGYQRNTLKKANIHKWYTVLSL